LLLQVFYSIRSERQLVEQIDYNLLFRWFVGLGLDDRRTTRQPGYAIGLSRRWLVEKASVG